uniref:SDR family NAD(P)-dependent oxidoreductase n=1 Tax=Leptospira ainazelensis TaxID=2810034 RepID=UPI001E5A470C|nr:SDR family NAD(P)-dependent oxidoreductase [Leptospira ainazelensis]
MKKAIVVGASSGIGAEIAKQLLEKGYSVALVGRRKALLKAIAGEYIRQKKAFIVTNDVSKFESVSKAFKNCVVILGGLDEIYYCAGVALNVKRDEFNTYKDFEMLNVNLLGAFAWLNLAAAYFQKKRNGVLVAISSFSGDRGRKAVPAYHASKAGLTTYLESLRNRLARLGVIVITIRPGYVETSMTTNAKGTFWMISAQEAATRILKAKDKRQENIYLSWRWRLLSVVMRSIPSFIFKRLNV